MKVEDKNILWLDLFDFLSYGKKIKLLNTIEKSEDLRKKFLTNDKVKSILTSEEFNKMALCLNDGYLNRYLANYEKDGVELVTFNHPNYPYRLKEISSPPLCLYCKGDISLLNSECFAIVGTRGVTDYGVVTTKQYCKALTEAGFTIVSGLALGVDAVAHKSALENNGRTIAVLAGGFKHIYPAVNYNLARDILVNDLLISEYPPQVLPVAYNFPIRNRIIAGLCKGVFVPEMGERSGTMHTINYAIEFNRDVFVLPGKINSPASRGCNELIKNMQGCITTTADDILKTYCLNSPNKNTAKQVDIEAQAILNFIQSEKHTFQEILEHTKMQPQQLNTLLMTLELEGLLVKLANNSFIMA